MLQLPQPHSFICGTTGTGKTMKFFSDFEGCGYGGIYINYTRIPSPFIKVDGSYEIEDLIEAIKDGDKLDYKPSRDEARARKEVAYMVHKLFEACDCGTFSEKHPFIFALDEAHLLDPEGRRNSQVDKIATTGRSAGFKGVFITQRPAMVSKTLVTQSDNHVIFTLSEYDREYMRTKGLDFDNIMGMVRSGNLETSHKYVVWSNGLINGPYQDKI